MYSITIIDQIRLYAFKVDNPTYIIHKETINAAEIALPKGDPPSSPPTTILLNTKVNRHIMDTIKNIMTEKASSPAGTMNYSPLY